jgi:hypothetical protein
MHVLRIDSPLLQTAGPHNGHNGHNEHVGASGSTAQPECRDRQALTVIRIRGFFVGRVLPAK